MEMMHINTKNFGLWIQIIMLALTFFGPIHYYWYFRSRLRRREKGEKIGKTNLITLNLTSGSNTFIWFIMPFLPQPRFSGVWNYVLYGNSISYIGLYISIFGIGMTIFSFLWFITVQLKNIKVTAEDYTAPNELLTDVAYKRIRHPITVTGCLSVMGLCLAVGSRYTTILLPVYLLQLHIFVLIEEKYALEPTFADDYFLYKKSTHRYSSVLSILLFFLGLSAIITDFLFVEVLY